MNYRLTADYRIPVLVYAYIQECSTTRVSTRNTRSMFFQVELTIKIKADLPSTNYVSNLCVQCNLPKRSTSASFELIPVGIT